MSSSSDYSRSRAARQGVIALYAASVCFAGAALAQDQQVNFSLANEAQTHPADTVYRQAAGQIQNVFYTQDGPAPVAEFAPPEPEPEPEGPWTLTELFADGDSNSLKDHNIKLYGNLVQSWAGNFQGPRDKFNGPVTWTDRSNEYQLNQLWLGLEKTTDTSKCDTDWGGRIDVNYGTSSRLMTQSGFEPHNFYNQAFYGFAFPNAYFEAAYKKLKVKMGRFVSPIGYFTVNTADNFFNTIPYTYQWGEPFTHTGIWGTYQYSESFTFSGAVIRGWDNFDNHNPHLGFMGTWGYTWKDKSNLTQVLFYSMEPNANFEFSRRYYQSLVYTRPINEKWNYVGQSDFGVQDEALASGKPAYWYGINQYLYYVFNDQITFGANFEWWRDEEGYRVAGFLPSSLPSGITNESRGFPTNRFGYKGNFYQVTVGPKIYPTKSKNFFVRPNFRADWFQGAVLNPDGLKPFDDGNKNWQTLFVTDVVLLF